MLTTVSSILTDLFWMDVSLLLRSRIDVCRCSSRKAYNQTTIQLNIKVQEEQSQDSHSWKVYRVKTSTGERSYSPYNRSYLRSPSPYYRRRSYSRSPSPYDRRPSYSPYSSCRYSRSPSRTIVAIGIVILDHPLHTIVAIGAILPLTISILPVW